MGSLQLIVRAQSWISVLRKWCPSWELDAVVVAAWRQWGTNLRLLRLYCPQRVPNPSRQFRAGAKKGSPQSVLLGGRCKLSIPKLLPFPPHQPMQEVGLLGPHGPPVL